MMSDDEDYDRESTDDGGTSGGEEPTDPASEEALVEQVDPAEAQNLGAMIASFHRIEAGFGADELRVASDNPEQASGGDVRAECIPKGCDLSVLIDGEIYALTGCGDGTCPTCPPGLGNLLVRSWCVYTGVSSGAAAIVLNLAFGGKLGPFRV